MYPAIHNNTQNVHIYMNLALWLSGENTFQSFKIMDRYCTKYMLTENRFVATPQKPQYQQNT